MLKIFYPPKRLCESRTQWGPFDRLSILLYLRNGFDTFKIQTFWRPFLNLGNVLSSEGTLRSRTQMGSILIVSILLCYEKGI